MIGDDAYNVHINHAVGISARSPGMVATFPRIHPWPVCSGRRQPDFRRLSINNDR
jgi:hypothetical protein